MEGRGSEYKKLWSEEEDNILKNYIKVHGMGKWNRVAKETGLKRCGKSCRLRWINYLSPNVKRGDFSEEENDLIIRLHKLLGNRWSLIAGRVPGRTDNQVKNHWNTRLSKKHGVNKGKHKIGHSSSIFSKELEDNMMNNPHPNSGLVPPDVGNHVSTSEDRNQVRSLEDVADAQNLASNDCLENFSWFFNNDLYSCTPISMEFQDEPLDIFLQGL